VNFFKNYVASKLPEFLRKGTELFFAELHIQQAEKVIFRTAFCR
jgi:hypothetical protein